jgi:predicted  nucleic acid-binding Zn-ribbon protein
MPSKKNELNVKMKDLEERENRGNKEMEELETRYKYLEKHVPASKHLDDSYSRLLGEITTRKRELTLELREIREELYELESKIRELEKSEVNEPASEPRPK